MNLIASSQLFNNDGLIGLRSFVNVNYFFVVKVNKSNELYRTNCIYQFYCIPYNYLVEFYSIQYILYWF